MSCQGRSAGNTGICLCLVEFLEMLMMMRVLRREGSSGRACRDLVGGGSVGFVLRCLLKLSVVGWLVGWVELGIDWNWN